MSTLIDGYNNGDLADVEFDFVRVTLLLPNRKSKLAGDAAFCIAVRDTRHKHANEKIGSPLPSLCRWILRYSDFCARSNGACGRRAWLSRTVRYEWEKTCQWGVQAMGGKSSPLRGHHLQVPRR